MLVTLTAHGKCSAPPGFGYIVLQFHKFEMEGSECQFDYVEIRDGNSSTSPLLKKLCGDDKDGYRIVFKGPSMFIHFHADSSFHLKGFLAVYMAANRKTEGTIVV